MCKYIHNLVLSVNEQKQLLSGAGEVFKLENKLKGFYEKKYAIAFSSASQALLALVIALRIKNQGILTSPLTWGGSLAPFLIFNNKIRFALIDTDNYCIDPELFINHVTEKTKIVISTDFAGNPSNTSKLSEVTKARGILLINDSSQSFGAFDNTGKPAGYYADVIVLSFGPTKTFFGGEGGAIITDNFDIYKNLIKCSQHQDRQKKVMGFKNQEEFGINGRINPFAAYIINKNWDRYLHILRIRQEYFYRIYNQLCKDGTLKRKIFLSKKNSSSFWLPIFELTDQSIGTNKIKNILFTKFNFSDYLTSIKLNMHPEYSHLVNGYNKNLTNNLINNVTFIKFQRAWFSKETKI